MLKAEEGRRLASDLIAAAERETGLSDWGEPSFSYPLDMLCASFLGESGASSQQQAVFERQIIAHLSKRLRLYADRAAYPEIAEQAITAPLFVVGFPRSGTTILHSLLAADPRARSPLAWELAEPSPPPRAETFTTDPRIARSQAAIERLPARFRAMHAMGATLPDECNSIMQLNFQSLNFAASRPLPSYQQWLLGSDAGPAFALHRHVLQHLQAFVPRDWWVLKAPPHLFWLDQLFAAYPDARIVFTHRDPAQIMPSNSSLIAFIHEMAGNHPDPAELGRAETAKWKLGMEQAMRFRDARPDLAARFCDVRYADLVADPLGVAAAVYDHFAIPLTAPARAAMEAFMAANPQGKHGSHSYSASDFALDPEAIRRDFAPYFARYLQADNGARP